ncbi:Nif3-like dinuclear metal center hexameric protein [Patescibacteria group bacterium]|nr:Nif3-like dinuclear metal center hexameric protein [Patescibacteria group bacterium]
MVHWLGYWKTDLSTVQDLRKAFEKAVGHKVSLYNYGDNEIKDGIVAVVAGGGLGEAIEEVARNKANVFVTGITAKNDHSKKSHNFAKKHRINILGGTHYSTERFAYISMIDYFKRLGLSSNFIEDKPVMEDM